MLAFAIEVVYRYGRDRDALSLRSEDCQQCQFRIPVLIDRTLTARHPPGRLTRLRTVAMLSKRRSAFQTYIATRIRTSIRVATFDPSLLRRFSAAETFSLAVSFFGERRPEGRVTRWLISTSSSTTDPGPRPRAPSTMAVCSPTPQCRCAMAANSFWQTALNQPTLCTSPVEVA